MKIRRIRLKTSTMLLGIKTASELRVGDSCDPGWGGGKVISMERDGDSLVLRKDGKFKRADPNDVGEYDAIVIPWANVSSALAVDERPQQLSSQQALDEHAMQQLQGQRDQAQNQQRSQQQSSRR